MVKAVIIAVRKDDNGIITHVKSRVVVKNGNISDDVRMKSVVIQNITVLHVEYTVPNGTKVRVVDGRYLRTDANDTKEDNLGELPTFTLDE